MGNAKISAISDTGPLLHLSEINGIMLLNNFEKIYIPESVYSEYYKHKNVNDPDIFTLENIEQKKVPVIDFNEYMKKHKFNTLHRGEKDCLFLCHKYSINIILTDDLAVRDVAKALHITPVGSLGIVLKAYTENLIPFAQAEEFINNLYEKSSLFVTKTIVDIVIEKLSKEKY